MQRYPDLGIVLEAADAGTVASARVDDHVRAALGIHRDALWRNDAQQRVVDRTLERATVHHDLIVEAQHRRQSLPLVLEEVVAALAQRVPEEDGALREVDAVLRAVAPHLPRQRRIRLQLGELTLVDLFHALAVSVPAPASSGFAASARPSRTRRGSGKAVYSNCSWCLSLLIAAGIAGMSCAQVRGLAPAVSSAKRLHSMGIPSGSLSTTPSPGPRAQARTLPGGASCSRTRRGPTPAINGDGFATFRLGLRPARALAWLASAAFSIAPFRSRMPGPRST